MFVLSSERFRKKSVRRNVKPSGTPGDSMRALSAYLVLVFVPHVVYSLSQNPCADTQYNDAGNGCTYYTNCTVGQEIFREGTSTADRECKAAPYKVDAHSAKSFASPTAAEDATQRNSTRRNFHTGGRAVAP